MPTNIRSSSAAERQAIFNTRYAVRVAAGEYREELAKRRHPAPGNWQWCTSSEMIAYYDRETGEQIMLGHRYKRDGKWLTNFDPKWILHPDEGVIYGQGGG